MTPAEFVAMARELKELGATKLSATPDGAFEVTFAGNGPKLIPVQTPIQDIVDQERRNRLKSPEDAPTNAEGRHAWREDVMKMVTGG